MLNHGSGERGGLRNPSARYTLFLAPVTDAAYENVGIVQKCRRSMGKPRVTASCVGAAKARACNLS